jgi:lipopolysaccharide export LptBFGC system permease protein LptF
MAGLAMSGPVLGLVAMRFFSRGGVASVLVPIVATALPAATAVGMGAFFSMQAEKANGSTSDYEY